MSKGTPLQKEQYYYAFLGVVENYEGPEGREDLIRFFEDLDIEDTEGEEAIEEELGYEGQEGAYWTGED
jgi:hypothetical protein